MLRVCAAICLALALGCNDLLTAGIGIVAMQDAAVSLPPQDKDAAANGGSRDAASVLDAAPHAACVDLPDLMQAALSASYANSEVQTRAIVPTATCLNIDAGSGGVSAGEVVYQLSRLDRRPIFRGGRVYALSWPPAGKDTSLVALISDVYGSSLPCVFGDRVGAVDRAISSRGCTQLAPPHDASFMNVPASAVLGLGAVEFTLCEGRCPP